MRLGVSRSGFYAWLGRPRSQRSLEDEVLGVFDMTCWHCVSRPCARGRDVRGLPQDRGQRSAIADNVLDRQFQADASNQKWVADFTYIWAAEDWLYAAAVIDLHSRRIVGWSMQDNMPSQLVADALMR